ncbi:anti-repressor SinI family protein [Halobacillus sp. B23F22_1]
MDSVQGKSLKTLDDEWMELMKVAKALGFSKKEVQKFFANGGKTKE